MEVLHWPEEVARRAQIASAAEFLQTAKAA
jgi:hypothetical protein